MRRYIAGLLVAAAAMVSVPARAQPQGDGLQIYIFRVGQADSMLIVGPAPERRALLVDMGVAQDGDYRGTTTATHVARRIGEITGRRHVDYFLLTHFHLDHLGGARTGMAALVDQGGITIGTVIDTDVMGRDYVRPRRDPRPAYARRIGAWQRSGRVQRRHLPRFGTSQIQLGTGVSVDVLAFGGRFASGQPSVHALYERSHPQRTSETSTPRPLNSQRAVDNMVKEDSRPPGMLW